MTESERQLLLLLAELVDQRLLADEDSPTTEQRRLRELVDRLSPVERTEETTRA